MEYFDAFAGQSTEAAALGAFLVHMVNQQKVTKKMTGIEE
jgi:hypothetical protein